MTEQPWIKFYPRDWRGDQALRAVSLSARGLWMEMLCVMHEASPYGHLVLGDHAVSNAVLARMAGTSEEEVSALLIELQTAGVLSRTRKGVIYSRRMVKDRNRSEKGRKAVSKRWAEATDNTAENERPNRSPNRKPTTQKPDTRSFSNEKQRARRLASDPTFEAQVTALRTALNMRRSPSAADRAQLQSWIADGIDFEFHVLETARTVTARQAARGETIGGFKYLDGAVREYRDEWEEDRARLRVIAGGRA